MRSEHIRERQFRDEACHTNVAILLENNPGPSASSKGKQSMLPHRRLHLAVTSIAPSPGCPGMERRKSGLHQQQVWPRWTQALNVLRIPMYREDLHRQADKRLKNGSRIWRYGPGNAGERSFPRPIHGEMQAIVRRHVSAGA
jgi:hypothetical protein